ncbi:MAG: inositol monophosphatase [Gammaproteobacteria bacterium]|nr:inositol monophosphatase [Gammaproteobacteria bacterium]
MLGNLIEIIRDTGREVSKSRLQSVDGGKWEGDQLKTQADALAHKLLAMKLSDVLPIPVVSEENSFSQSEVRPDKYWLIDPIDGTRSLVDGFPGWVIQAALIQNNEPQIAVIFAPDLDLTFTAEKGEGAFCNSRKLSLDSADKSRLLLIDNYPEPRGIAADLCNGIPCTGYVECGSIALKICKIADGTSDLFVKDVPVRDWDIAAPKLIIEEAGGCLKTYSGRDYLLTGKFEKMGLIAARDVSVYKKCQSFLKTRTST